MPTIAVMLHNVRSAHNVGSIFRTAEAAGVSHVYLSGYTPQPIDRFGRPQKDISKTALGAEGMLPWTYAKSPAQLIARLKKDGWRVVAVEQGAHASDYRTYQLGGPTAFLFGNEVRGVSPSLLARCDAAVEIPMYGKKESLNVSVAAGVVLFQLRGS
jgi:23S rRNA (guanosine2251-2'-O)-methyltransferase